MEWAYGVTTVPSRQLDLLPRTLTSLAKAGFDKPRLFVDGESEPVNYLERLATKNKECGWLHVTVRNPPMHIHGNWYLGIQELYIRNPTAQRYVMFQDDLVACKNLKGYLEHVRLEKSYLNLFTFRDNEDVIKGKPYGRFYDASLVSKSNNQWQTGRGALALVFNNEGVRSLLASEHMVSRPHEPRESYPRRIDGGVVAAMNKAGFRELIHNPSLVQHIGEESTIGSRKGRVALSFPGEDFDCLEFLKLNRDNPANHIVIGNGVTAANYADLDREIAALEKAIADDRERLRTATDSALIRKTRAYIRDYSLRLDQLRRERV